MEILAKNIDLDVLQVQAIVLKAEYERRLGKCFLTYETKLSFEGRVEVALSKIIGGACSEIWL